MKKSCEKCRAFIGHHTLPECEFGVPLKKEFDKKQGIYVNVRPLKSCPKPLTYVAYFNARQKYREGNNR